MTMTPDEQHGMELIAEGCKVLGWAIGFERDREDGMVYALVVGEYGVVEAMCEKLFKEHSLAIPPKKATDAAQA